ncbi:Ig-like domain-containing protein [Psychromicrobium xiongbiense]|uniref:Ig-like domain-containing protein n=1 Tax=Psychromicrobium xiongbiense TaxID=3051184 RepID=UPI002557380C|nr:Ig-like domain-containing protein [Psychromicrobium sp. YIM S02556]
MALTGITRRLKSKSRYLAGGVVTLLAGALVAAAVIYPGFKTTDVNLNDGSVWVTNRSKSLVGHLNVQSRILDGGFSATTSGFDVLQQASQVFMDNDAGSVLSPVDVPAMVLQPEAKLGGGKQAELGTNILALSDARQSKVWVLTANTASSFDEKNSKAALEGLANPAVVVGLDDTVYVVSGVTGELTTLTTDANGAVSARKTEKLSGLSTESKVQITVVGNKPVVLDEGSGKVYLPGGKTVQLDAASTKGAQLQQHSADGDHVAIGTGKGLIWQPLDGSGQEYFDPHASGTPAAPIQQQGCVHMAWSGANKYVRYCKGQDNSVQDVPTASAGAVLVLRQNRDAVVLNDVNSGIVWLVNQNMVIVNNWQDLQTQTKNSPDSQKDSADPNFVNTLPDRTKPNRPPNAVPDDFGVRAGRTTLLPVLFNDSDPDGDVLTVRPPSSQPKIGTVETVYGGTGLQITIPANTSITSDTFTYTAMDGRGGEATATVTLHVIPEGQNSPPAMLRDTTLVIEQGQTLTQNLLTDWRDPDGDDIFLTNAVSDDKSAQITTTPAGDLTYRDQSTTPGIKTMTISVSDGSAPVQKQIKINVKAPASSPPIANADFVRAVVGQPVTVAPLKNDIDPSGKGLRLASVEQNPAIDRSDIAEDNTFTVTPKNPGPVYLTYQVSNGPQSAMGLIRVDVVEPDTKSPPIAVKDLALLPSGGSVLVDVLGNDTDPAGGVLVVRSATAPSGAPISVSVLDHGVVKLTDTQGLRGAIDVTYTVANAFGTSTGHISVIPLLPSSTLLPPIVNPDEATVRANDVVDIPVLANDIDPNGQPLKSPAVVPNPGLPADAGTLFADQDQLRFLAGNVPGTYTGIYSVTNAAGQKASANITIHVLPADPAHNQAPTPKALVGHVIAGSSTNIQVPLSGIDPDGDSVQLVGIDKAPTLGTALISSNFIQYTAASSSSGTDTFTYRVRDRFGAEGTASVRVGVAGLQLVNHPPVGNDDVVSMRPGRKVALDVLLNDSDPDGDSLHVVKDGFNGPSEMAPEVDAQGRVVLTSPTKPGVYTMGYTLSDGKATAQANIRMTVTADAPLKAPIARDDHVTEQETLGKTAVDVPILKNDEDPDGTTDDLKIAIRDGHPTASITGDRTMHVTLTDAPQMIPYTVTDVDGLQGTAIVWVPGLTQMHPVLQKTDPLQVVAGQSVTLDLNEYVKVRSGRSPRLTQADRISLIGAPSDNSASGNGTSIVYNANPDFFGKGSITFEVTDGTSPTDPEGLKSTLTVMVDVKPDPSRNRSPQMAGSSLQVPKGKEATLDLSTLAQDPENDPLKFSLDGDMPKDFDVSLDGSTLKVKVKGDVQAGANGSVGVKVNDGHNPDVKAAITVVAEATDKPLPVANDDVVPDALAGRTVTVDVLSNDVNPFPETPLKLVDVTVEAGGSAITAAINGDRVDVKSDENFKGAAVVRYTVQDATGDVTRRATARIQMNIKGKPDAPNTPRVVEVKDHSVLLNWAPSSDNGSPITGYKVSYAGGSQQCPANTCQITGLTNGTAYTFTVVATNAVGDSPASPASAPATPNRAPDAPPAPGAKFGDQQITVTWSTPSGDYTPVTKFDVEISPAPAGQNPQRSGVSGNSLVWTGLSNGTAYTFRVRALNTAPDPSAWSPYSVAETPAGVPAQPTAPTANNTSAVAGKNTVAVNWTAPNGNGDNQLKYTLYVLQGGSSVQTIGPLTATNATVELPNSTTPYQFAVKATNKAGDSPTSAPSAPMRSVSKPGQMAPPNIAPANIGGAGRQIAVTWQPLSGTALNGSSPNEMSYWVSVNGGNPVQVTTSPANVSAVNGQATTATIYAKSSAYGSAGDASGPSNQVTPYGQPGTPAVSGSQGGAGDPCAYFSWTAPGNADIAKTEFSSNGGASWQSTGATSNTKVCGTYNQSHTVLVRNTNSIGTQTAPPASATANGGGPPPPQYTTINNPGPKWNGNTCSEPDGGGAWNASNTTCQGVSGGANPPWPWFPAGGTAHADKCGSPWGTSGWYHIPDGTLAGRWVTSRDVSSNGPLYC